MSDSKPQGIPTEDTPNAPCKNCGKLKPINERCPRCQSEDTTTPTNKDDKLDTPNPPAQKLDKSGQDDKQLTAILDLISRKIPPHHLKANFLAGIYAALQERLTSERLAAQHNCIAIPDDQPNDVHLKYVNQGFRLGQLQLVSELEGEVDGLLEMDVAAGVPKDEADSEWNEAMHDVVKHLQHKKQELEGKI